MPPPGTQVEPLQGQLSFYKQPSSSLSRLPIVKICFGTHVNISHTTLIFYCSYANKLNSFPNPVSLSKNIEILLGREFLINMLFSLLPILEAQIELSQKATGICSLPANTELWSPVIAVLFLPIPLTWSKNLNIHVTFIHPLRSQGAKKPRL